MQPLTYPIPLLLFLAFSCLFPLAVSDPRVTEAGLFCGPSASSNTQIRNFVAAMESIADSLAQNGWGTNASGSVYGLAQCFSDLSTNECLLCFAQARTKLPRCLPTNAGRIFLDGCFLRYDNHSFYSETTDVLDRAVCGTSAVYGTNDQADLAQSVRGVLANVMETAVGNDGFGVGKTSNVYGLAQCWKSIGKEGCRECLQKAEEEVLQCLPSKEGKALNAGCYLRYSTEKFYNDPQEKEGMDNTDDDGNNDRAFVFSIASSAVIVAMLSILGVFIGYGRLEKRRKERRNLPQLSIVVRNANLHFKYEILEKATNYFDVARKLGQGGAGSVYKGILPDGKTVAVKRLFFNTRQWVDEFFNEVNLISGIRHPNLVQLLGCSIEGPESLLVYEYVPNKSLDQILFNKRKTQTLNWEERYGVIVGTAKGLAYLHDGSGTRIIHRDIKSSNILLDENLEAKIADFGLVRCFSADETHISTGIAGTLGYMAPEYLVRGQLTEKADVYSFGVLVLEIVSGRKNSVYVEESSSVLQKVWKHFKSDKLQESIDESLKGQFPVKQASNTLQIGLLCTQASVCLRPSMTQVVQMLTEEDYPIPLPNQPPFLNNTILTKSTSKSVSFASSASPATTDGLTTPASDTR